MRLTQILLFLTVILLVSACNLDEGRIAPTAAPTEAVQVVATRTPLPTLTSFVVNSSGVNTQVFVPTIVVSTAVPNQVTEITRLLNNGRGLSTGSAMNDGNFEVEGYCNLLNPAYGVRRDDVNWFCTFQGQAALQLRQQHFDDICRRTYNNPNAFAVQIPGNEIPAFRWRCYEYTITPTPIPQKYPFLLNNGRGLTTGSVMNNGNFEVEAYCTTINPNYGVTEDHTYWYCTENGQRVLTLGSAEFDDICIRTYNNPAAYAEQIQSDAYPVYNWRCYELR